MFICVDYLILLGPQQCINVSVGICKNHKSLICYGNIFYIYMGYLLVILNASKQAEA